MKRDRIARFLTEKVWPQRGVWAWCLFPLSLLYVAVISIRRALYYSGILPIQSWSTPVIVVGNINVGGSGKTPLVIHIVEQLHQQGWQPGVVTRGYGAGAKQWPQFVDARSDARYSGDEPVMIAKRTGCPVMVDPDRANAVTTLLAMGGVDIVISDDGLQHYRMGRDVEVVVIDGQRRGGNGWCLPAGPLREPWGNRKDADLIVCNGGQPEPGEFAMRLLPRAAINLADRNQSRPLAEFSGLTVHAVAGIGAPQRFFDMLADNGLTVTPHAFPDHHRFDPRDFMVFKEQPVLMTAKDAIKCQRFATDSMWMVPVEIEIDPEFMVQLTKLLQRLGYDRQEAA